ncbi:MAG: UDP-glucose 4-epimerase GalE [Chitinispirillaceae bacterium]|jgi:UDP-glucose 4-epimerase|nr:UDP-glucose 4-epimerase GalE [Chitinispirillaceae bacterium]
MNVLVVGGAGYIGSHVVRALLDKKFSITVFDNLSTGCRENLFDGASFIMGDIREFAQISEAMKREFDAVIHLAALKAAGESMLTPGVYAVNNISGTINLLNAAIDANVKHIVFSSTAAVYGAPHYFPVDETHPCDPENFYGYTKLEVERILQWYYKLHGLRFAALRYFNAAGYDPAGRIAGLERNPNNLLPIVMEVAAGIRKQLEIFGDDYETPDGTCVRDYVHVSDLADAHVAALDYLARNDTSITVNLGTGKGISVMEMVTTARQITGRPIPSVVSPRRAGDPAALFASSNAALKILGWKATRSDVGTLVASTWKMYTR